MPADALRFQPQVDRHPQIRIEIAGRRHHPDDPIGQVIEDERAADRGVGAVEALKPQPVTHHDQPVRAGPIFVGRERATNPWARAEDVEEIGGGGHRADEPRFGAAGQVEGEVGEHREAVEHARALAPGQHLVSRQRSARHAVPPFVHVDETAGVRERQRPQQDGVEQAEDRGDGGDADRERHDRGCGEAVRAEQVPAGVSQVLDDRLHAHSLSNEACREGSSEGSAIGTDRA